MRTQGRAAEHDGVAQHPGAGRREADERESERAGQAAARGPARGEPGGEERQRREVGREGGREPERQPAPERGPDPTPTHGAGREREPEAEEERRPDHREERRAPVGEARVERDGGRDRAHRRRPGAELAREPGPEEGERREQERLRRLHHPSGGAERLERREEDGLPRRPERRRTEAPVEALPREERPGDAVVVALVPEAELAAEEAHEGEAREEAEESHAGHEGPVAEEPFQCGTERSGTGQREGGGHGSPGVEACGASG